MTATKFEDIKPGDRIRHYKEGVVKTNDGSTIVFEREPGEILRSITRSFEWELELLERPLPPEPAEGSVVIFRDGSNNLQAYRLWAPHLGWQHAGKSTPSGGRTWADLMQLHEGHERTVIEP